MLSIGVTSPGQSGLLICHVTIAANLLLSFSVFNLGHQQAVLCQYSQLVSSASLVLTIPGLNYRCCLHHPLVFSSFSLIHHFSVFSDSIDVHIVIFLRND